MSSPPPITFSGFRHKSTLLLDACVRIYLCIGTPSRFRRPGGWRRWIARKTTVARARLNTILFMRARVSATGSPLRDGRSSVRARAYVNNNTPNAPVVFAFLRPILVKTDLGARRWLSGTRTLIFGTPGTVRVRTGQPPGLPRFRVQAGHRDRRTRAGTTAAC